MNKTYEEVCTDTYYKTLVLETKRGAKNHDREKPSLSEFEADGCLTREAWFRDGRLHRGAGPAEKYYEEDGITVWYECRWLEGEFMDRWYAGLKSNHKETP